MDLEQTLELTRGSNTSTSTPASISIAHFESIERKPGRIEPSWVLSGQPMVCGGSHSTSEDGCSSTAVWECTAGSFRWYYAWDETIFVVDGGVKLTSPKGETIVLKAGDLAHFPAGTSWVWEVESHIRKVAFFHRPASKLERFIRTIREKLGLYSTPIKVGLGAAATASLVAMLALA